MPPHVLIVVEIEVSQQRKECVGIFVKIYQGGIVHEPIYAEIVHHLECQWQTNVMS